MVGTKPTFDSNRNARCSSISKTTASSSLRPQRAVTRQSSHALLCCMTQVSHEMTSRGGVVVGVALVIVSPSRLWLNIRVSGCVPGCVIDVCLTVCARFGMGKCACTGVGFAQHHHSYEGVLRSCQDPGAMNGNRQFVNTPVGRKPSRYSRSVVAIAQHGNGRTRAREP